MEILLLRHGKTEGNLAGCYCGRTDEPLCEAGVAGALAAGTLPDVLHVLVSPMLRARQTAKLCFPNAAQTVIPDLREMDFGDFEGRTADDMVTDRAYRAWVDTNCEAACPNGESIAAFAARVRAAFFGVVQEAIAQGEKRLIIVSHGGTMMAILSGFAQAPRSYFDWFVPNCCGYRIRLDEKRWITEQRFRSETFFSYLPLLEDEL